jgi:iron complex transport system permease protein
VVLLIVPVSKPIVLVLTVCMVIVSLASLVGGTGIWWLQVAPDWPLWWQLRVPRVINGAAVGALLAIAGLLLQVVLRNPLADPYLFGSASGAALAQVLALGFLGPLLLPASGQFLLNNVAGFAGALLTALIVMSLARRSGRLTAATHRLIVMGVAVASLLGALLQLSLLWLSDRQVRGIYFWLLGSVPEDWQPALFYGLTIVVVGLAARLSFTVDALRHGEVIARNWGVEGRSALRWLLILASLATALAVGTAGALGFVGLAAPHLARLLTGPRASHLIAGSAAIGAALVVLADALARWLLSPVVLPVGLLTTLLGVPWLLHLLIQRGGQARHD